jgi:hypothetical protein
MGRHEQAIHEHFAASSSKAGKPTGLPWFEYTE